MIRIENLVKIYGAVHALDGLSLQVEKGAVYGFLGPNGAGKTTTLRILSGLARPQSGRAWIMGKEISSAGVELRRMIGVLPEEPAFYPWITPREYLRDLTAPLYGFHGEAAARRSDELLNIVGLKEAANRRMGGFSRGMRQRMGLAQALIHQPPVLLLDEPVSALDPAGRKEVLDLIESLRGNTTILLSTHLLADVERVCDTVGIINQGRLITQAPRAELLARYAKPLFEVEAEKDPAAWLKWLQQQDFVTHVTISGHTVRVLVKDAAAAQASLLESLTVHGLQVRRFEKVQLSLEDVFLQLTGRQA